MRIPLGWKLGFTYLILIVMSMVAFGYFTMNFLQESFFEQKKAALFTHANIAANSSAPFLQNEAEKAYLYSIAREAGERVGNRFLILNQQQEVVADSANDVVGEKFSHGEILAALAGENAAAPHYEEAFGWVMYLAVPVYSGQQVIGAVFISADINPLVAELDSIRQRLFYFSLISGLLVFLFSLLAGRFLTRPINQLITAAKKLASGNYGVQIKGFDRRDEYGELTKVFNEMSAQIGKEDSIRKQFIANASHELKSPVAALKALLEAFSEESHSQHQVDELIADLKLETNRLGKLVEDLLVLGRLEGSKHDLQVEETSVGELVEAVKKAVYPMAQKKGITVEALHGGDIYWKMDGGKIFRAVRNLVDNSINYSKHSDKVIIGFRKEGSNLLIYVEDHGGGIPEGEIPHLFERFYRVDKARSRTTGGWGLGLSIVKEIIELHGGNITVKSKPGVRTVFTICLTSL